MVPMQESKGPSTPLFKKRGGAVGPVLLEEEVEGLKVKHGQDLCTGYLV